MKIVLAGPPRVRGREEIARIEGLVRAIAAPLRPRSGAVSISLIGERRMALLNRRYKGRRGAAEILTFPYRHAAGRCGEMPLGEICLCWSSLERGARRRRVSTRAYAARLVVHGLAHLGGRRHGTAAEERRMESAERRLLKGHITARDIERLFA